MVRMHFALEYVYHYSTNEFAMFSNSLWQRKGKTNLQCSPRAYPQWHSTTFLMVFLLELRKQSIDTNQVVDLTGFIHSAWTCVMCSCPMHLCALCFEFWSSTPSETIRNQLNNHISCRNVLIFHPYDCWYDQFSRTPCVVPKPPRWHQGGERDRERGQRLDGEDFIHGPSRWGGALCWGCIYILLDVSFRPSGKGIQSPPVCWMNWMNLSLWELWGHAGVMDGDLGVVRSHDNFDT